MNRGHRRLTTATKALLRATDRVKGRPERVNELKFGQRVALYTTNLDITTSVYDCYYICEGDKLRDVRPITGHAGALQR